MWDQSGTAIIRYKNIDARLSWLAVQPRAGGQAGDDFMQQARPSAPTKSPTAGSDTGPAFVHFIDSLFINLYAYL